MKKQTLIIGSKAQAAVMKNVHAECRSYASQQAQLKNQMDTIDEHFGAPEKVTGYTHIVWAVMVQAGADVPSRKYTDAINDKGECGKYLKRLADFIRNSGDTAEPKEFNIDSYVKAVMTKCAGNDGLFAALEKAMKAAKKAVA